LSQQSDWKLPTEDDFGIRYKWPGFLSRARTPDRGAGQRSLKKLPIFQCFWLIGREYKDTRHP
jgi:hypothetical protein